MGWESGSPLSWVLKGLESAERQLMASGRGRLQCHQQTSDLHRPQHQWAVELGFLAWEGGRNDQWWLQASVAGDQGPQDQMLLLPNP